MNTHGQPLSGHSKALQPSKERRKFDDLPLGTRFRYIGGSDVWVKIDNGGTGAVAEWTGPNSERVMQMICSFAETEGERRTLEVELAEVTPAETRVIPARDADHCGYPDCEKHWELVVDWALAAMKNLHESAEPDTDHPEIPAVIPAAAFRAFVDEHARLMRIRASAPHPKAGEQHPLTTPLPVSEAEALREVIGPSANGGAGE